MTVERETASSLEAPGGYDVVRTVQALCSSPWFGLLVGMVVIGLWGLFVVETLPGILASPYGMIDFTQYWDAARALLDHISPYSAAARQHSPSPFVSPPILAILIIPFAPLPLIAANILWYAVSLAFLGMTCAGIVQIVGGPWHTSSGYRYALAAIVTLAFFFYPVWVSAKLGQVTGLIVFLVVASLVALSRSKPTLGGVLLGAAIAIKLTPLPIIAYAIWVGWRRCGISAIVTTLLLQMASAVAFPRDFVQYWLSVFPSIVPSDARVNLSLLALVRRFRPGPPLGLYLATIVVCGLVLVAPFALAYAAKARNRELLLPGLALLISAMSIAEPLVEHHYLLWLLLPIWVVLVTFVREQRLAGLGVLGGIFVILSQPYRLSRILRAVLPLSGSPDLLGGSVLEFGAVLLYLLLLIVIVQRLVGDTSLRHRAMVDV